MDKTKLPLLVIGGPTGVGKTDLSIQLAQALDGEIINGDSLQFYKGLDIGTGKILPQEMQGVVHHLLDILAPDQVMDAHRFKLLAQDKIEAISQRGKLPIIVGGTGLYLEGLLLGLDFGGQAGLSSWDRAAFEASLQALDDQSLWQELAQKDPEAAANIPLQNRRRVLRALEVIALTGDLFSKQSSHAAQIKQYDSLLLVLDRPRDQLYDRINQRVLGMIAAGLEAEAKWLYDAYQGQLVAGAKGIGYKEWWPYFQGQVDLDQVVATIQQNSRRYAKRQLTWFRNRFEDKWWLDAQTPSQVLIQQVAQHFRR